MKNKEIFTQLKMWNGQRLSKIQPICVMQYYTAEKKSWFQLTFNGLRKVYDMF